MFSSEFLRFALILSLWWFGCFLLFTGFGLLVFRLHGLKLRSYTQWLDCSWLGWSLLTFFLLLIHFFYRIDGWLFLGGALVAGWSLLRHRQELWSLLRQLRLSAILAALLVLVITFWMTNRATGPVGRSDTALYHLAVVQWNENYPLVKGLANLHGRFGFNNTFLLLAALFDVGFWKSQATHIANTFLVLLLLQQSILHAMKLLKPLSNLHWRRTALFASVPTAWEPVSIFYTLILPLCLLEVFNGNATSLTSDLPVTLLTIVLTGQVLRFITQDRLALTTGQRRELTQEDKFQLTAISLLICLGATIKISFIALGVAVVGVILVYLYQQALLQSLFTSFKLLLSLFSFVCLYLVIWMVRGIWLSGYPAYPLTIGGVAVPWQVPRSLVLSEAYWIQSWARLPWAPWPDVVGNWRWLEPWLQTVPEEWRKLLLVTIIALVPTLLLATISRKTTYGNKRLSWFFLAPPLLSLCYWFFTAPSFRFATGSLWMLTVGALLLAIDAMTLVLKRNRHLMIWGICAVVWLLLWPTNVVWWLPVNPTAILPPLTQPSVVEQHTDSGLRVAIPVAGEYACWNYPQPCTPYFRKNLHTFVQNDLTQGFYLDDQFMYADMLQTMLPPGITAPSAIGVKLVSDLIPKPKGEQNKAAQTLQLLVYSEQATTVNLVFIYVLTSKITEILSPVQLTIQSSSAKKIVELLPASNYITITFPLQRDFSVLTIQPSEGLIQLEPKHTVDTIREEAEVVISIDIQSTIQK